ncbi:MAG TPA: hypothetical protein VMY77_14440 [Chitinophagaceae bacterium]|nr:hypothetical protein [Chitinophagaceae bacterium]
MFRFYSKLFTAVILLVSVCVNANAQFFYKDIWVNQQLIKEFAILKNENIRTVSVKSFEDDGEPSEGFYCERKIDRNFTKSEMISRSQITQQSLLVSHYNDKGWIIQTVDSTQTSLARSQYDYDTKGRITMVTNFTKANDETGGITETHQFIYNAAGKPEKMIRKKNNADVSVVHFTIDEKGNVIDEEEIIRGRKGKKYLYYYDDKNRLTDVVHYNERAKRLLPDYMYEYNQLGQVKQMISTEDNISNYYIWKYTYNDQRLRESEKCYSKERRLLGSVQYEYK